MPDTKPKLAGQGQRIINFVVDMTIIAILWVVLTFILLILGLDQTYRDETGEQVLLIPLLSIVPTFWGYYIFTEYMFQRTLGKLFTKTKVVSSTWDNPTLLQIIFRTLSRSIPFEYFSYFVTVEGVHDRLSKTRVIKLDSIKMLSDD